MVFEYRDYKKYLNHVLSTAGSTRGSRSRLADALRCQTAFISHVLNADSHFSLEHAMVISKFLNLTAEESRYFILLVGLGRAGTKALEEHFHSQINEIQEKRALIKERIKTDHKLTPEIQMRYYSSWYYAAIHVATSIPAYQTRDAIAEGLNLSRSLVGECLDFLIEAGLVISQKGKYLIGPARMHLGADSSMISKLHANWRLKSIQSLERPLNSQSVNTHYSTVLTISRTDAKRVREILLRAIEETEKVFVPSPEEVVYCIGIDWFQVSKEDA